MVNQDLGRVAVVLRGEYDPAASYERLDCVSFQGSSYLVRKHCTGVTPAEGEYYQLAAKAGEPFRYEDFTAEQLEALRGPEGIPGPAGDNTAALEAAQEASAAAAAANKAAAEAQAVVDTVMPDVNQLMSDKLDKPATPPSAAGKVLRVLAVNEDGTFTCEWADALGGGVTDVTVGGESVVLDGIACIPVAGYNKLGAIVTGGLM